MLYTDVTVFLLFNIIMWKQDQNWKNEVIKAHLGHYSLNVCIGLLSVAFVRLFVSRIMGKVPSDFHETL